jgi:hypothetical protein
LSQWANQQGDRQPRLCLCDGGELPWRWAKRCAPSPIVVHRGLGVLALSVLALAHVDGCELDAAEQLAGEAERPVDELARGESPFATLPLLARGKLFERRGDRVHAPLVRRSPPAPTQACSPSC